MAKSAVTGLTEHLESIRREAYTEGYAAGMRAVMEFSTSRTAKPKATVTKATAIKATSSKAAAAKSTTATTAAPKRQRRAQAKPAPRQTRRGDNMRRIAEAMMTLPDHSGPAAAIKKVLAGTGHDIPYTSIRHGLGQLQARGEASVGADGKTWSYTAPAS
jgi:transcription initiation factor TFIID subunit TAF12